MAEYHIRWDPTNKKWEASVDGGAFADLVECPTIETLLGNGISAPSGVASKGIFWYDSTANRFKFKENNGAADTWCRESGYPATGLNINGLTEDTTPDWADFLPLYDVSGAAVKKVKPTSLPFAGVMATRSSNQVYTGGVVQKIQFNSESFDTHGFHDNATNNTRLTVPTGMAGYYLIGGAVYVTGSGALVSHNVRVTKGAGGTVLIIHEDSMLATATAHFYHLVPILAYLADADYVEFADSVGAAVTVTITAASYSPLFWMYRIGR